MEENVGGVLTLFVCVVNPFFFKNKMKIRDHYGHIFVRNNIYMQKSYGGATIGGLTSIGSCFVPHFTFF
jgi:hypothetical protein